MGTHRYETVTLRLLKCVYTTTPLIKAQPINLCANIIGQYAPIADKSISAFITADKVTKEKWKDKRWILQITSSVVMCSLSTATPLLETRV